MVVQNCSNIDNIRLYRLTWKYIKIHEIGTQITIPNFIFIFTCPETLDLYGFSPFSIFFITQIVMHSFRYTQYISILYHKIFDFETTKNEKADEKCLHLPFLPFSESSRLVHKMCSYFPEHCHYSLKHSLQFLPLPHDPSWFLYLPQDM